MKAQARFLGIDDAPFRFGQARVRLVGVVARGAGYVEGVLTSDCAVDGTDATDRAADLVRSSRFAPTLRCVFVNGVAFGGFNVLDLDTLHDRTGVPVVAVARRQPDADAIRKALSRHFVDWQARWRLVAAADPKPVANGRHRLWVSARGLGPQEVAQVLVLATVRGALPEPLRLAHVIASGLERGESRGKA